MAGRTDEHQDTGSVAWVSDQPPSRAHTLFAMAVAVCATIGFLVVLPYAQTPLARLNAFFPTLDAIVFVTDLVTAVLLLAQYSITRSKALLALASGYLFTALIVIPHALTFAGAFSPSGLLGAGIQTGSWLFIFWHVGFSASLLAYALLRSGHPSQQIAKTSAAPTIAALTISLMVLVVVLTWLATAGAHLLPAIILDASRISPIVRYPISFTIFLSAAALAALTMRNRRSVLDQWLMVVAFVSIGELAFSGLIPTVRFSAGFYAGRAFSLLTASIVLIVLLEETTRLYARLMQSNALLRREQSNKLINLEAITASIAHEVRQPLTAISINAAVGLELLKHDPPNLEEVTTAFRDIVESSRAANDVFEGIRTLFGKDDQKVPIDINEIATETIRSMRTDLAKDNVTVRFELTSTLPPILGNRNQIRELIINLVVNATEAMRPIDGERMVTVRTGEVPRGGVELSVEDNGRGFEGGVTERLFEAFVTTKSGGMGLGLAICRLIAQRHGGIISGSNAKSGGAIIQVTLPAAR